MRVSVCLLASLASLASIGLPLRSGAQSVTPRFGWPAGSKATAVTELRTTVSGNSAGMTINDSSHTRTTFAFEVRPHSEGLEVVTAPGVVERLVASSLPQPVDAAAVSAQGGTVIVSRAGTFVRVADLAALKRRTDSVMAPTLQQMRQLAPAMVATLEQSMSEPALSANAAVSFLTQYTSMVGRDWMPGDSAASTTAVPAPFAPGVTMTIPRVLRFDGVVSCADPSRRVCWQFTTRTEMSREAMRPALLEMVKQMGMPESMVDQMPIPESTTITVQQVDAATLLPVRFEIRTTGGSSGGMIAMLTGSTSVTVYRWQ